MSIDVEATTAAISEGATPTAEGVRGPGDVAIGTRIGRFEVTGKLGHGGMGVVLAARDPSLDRAVAIKLLREGAGREGALRLGREAQAMAKLSHPNVVTVYEIGEHDGSIYIAMELVDGRTLRQWRGAAPRTWREVVAKYVDAGRGLAAAHAAGLVHRDFKPDNVLLGADGRARVTDFGLVAAESRVVSSSDAVGVTSSDALTMEGALMGTPAYMAPEQWAGEPVDARTDQFAFCVALWEAVFGERPFRGDSTPALREAILGAAPQPPPRRTDAARWLAQVLTRGLARSPADRWPSVDALLERLQQGLRPRHGRVIAAIALGVVAAGGVGIGVWKWRSAAPSCDAVGREVDAVWGAPRRAAVGAALGDEGGEVIAGLDRYATRWAEMRVETCASARDGKQTAAIRALRERCLDSALASADRVASELGARVSVPAALTAVELLPDLERCADEAALAALEAYPTDPARQRKLEEVDALLGSAQAALAVDRDADARELAQRALADAETVGYHPAIAAVHQVIGESLMGSDLAAAEASLRAALRAADAGSDDYRRLDAYLELIGLVGNLGARHDEARALIADARAILTRIASPTGYQAHLLSAEADLTGTSGDDAGAIPLMQQAMPLYEEAFGGDSRRMTEARYRMGAFHLAVGDLDAAEPILVEARAGAVKFFGEESAMMSKLDNALAVVKANRGDLDGAIVLQERALAVRAKLEGADSPGLANGLYTLGAFYKMTGRTDEAIAVLIRALAVLEKGYGADHPRVLMALNELADTYLSADRFEEGTPQAVRAVEIADRLDHGADIEAKSRYLLASALWKKDRRRALELAHRARDEYRAMGDERNAKTIEAWLASPDPED